VKDSAGRLRLKENLQHYGAEYLILILLLIAAASVMVAQYHFLAIKKILFLINIFLLFLITRNIARDRQKIIRLWQAAAVGGIIVIVVALLQFIAVLFAPLYSFWQFWADKVIGVFYGINLAHLLSYSNTWFSYYVSNPPTLRLFSVFPDAHSFAMSCILMIPIFLGLALYFKNERRKRIFYWLMAILATFGIVMSGSRGAWLSAIPVVTVALAIYGRKFETYLTKKVLLNLAIFVLFFLASIAYPPLLYTFQSWQGSNASTTFSFFERAKSISDLDELSNKSRLEIWGVSIKSIVVHPFLGVGLGNYFNVLGESTDAAKKGASAHNLYLDFASEIGIFGTLVLIAIFANILYTAWLVFRRQEEPHFKIYGLLTGLYFLWVAAYSFFDVVLLNDKVLLLLMLVLAALYNLRNMIFKPKKI
jgi:O-antigen ligase